MALALTDVYDGVVGDRRKVVKSVAFDSSYPTGGESLTAADFGLTVIDYVLPSFSVGFSLEYDKSNSKLKAFYTNADGNVSVNTGTVTDDDSAASNGTAVYVVPDVDGVTAYLESTTAGNADTTFTIGSGGPAVFVNDNNTPGGVQLYYDEDATDADSRFLAVTATGADQFITAADGSKIRVVYDASAATNGVAVYIDDDAASAHLKLLFVSPTNANGTYTTDDTVGAALADGAMVEVANTTSLAAITGAIVTAYGY